MQRLSQKIVLFVIKEPNFVHRYFKSCLLNLEWVPPKFKRCCTKTINYKFANQSICEAINELIKIHLTHKHEHENICFCVIKYTFSVNFCFLLVYQK